MLSILTSVLWFLYIRILIPFSFWIFLILATSSLIGLDTGIHRWYVNSLVKLFDYVRVTIEETEGKKKEQSDASEGDKDDVNDEKIESYYPHEDSIGGSLYQRTLKRLEEQSSDPEEFKLDRMARFINAGIQAIIEDDVTKRFSSSSLKTWNLLTRTNSSFYQFSSPQLFMFWSLGFFYRFFILFPFRCCIMLFSGLLLLISTYLMGCIKDGWLKRFLYHHISIMIFRLMARTVSTIVTVHNPENKPKSGGICVANHTSPFDVIILSCDNSYALVGQKHGGVLGVMERALNRATDHVFFDRFQASDREFVTRKLREHASDDHKLPILIFPEGTCINNSAVLMFKKGAFEASDVIYPVAMKYDSRFGDAFWDSSKYGFGSYLLNMMTSWAIVCEIWYLEPMRRHPNESSIEFANRTKKEIAARGGLVDSEWDGQLKRAKVKHSQISEIQKKIASTIKNNNI